MRAVAQGLPGLIDVAAIVAVVLIAVGAGLVFFPAGLITGGVLLLVGCALHERGAPAEVAKTRDQLRAEVTR